MKSLALQTSIAKLDSKLPELTALKPDIVLLFSSLDLLENSDLVKKLRAAMPDSRLLGCSTSGEIGARLDDNSISLMALKFAATKLQCTSVDLGTSAASFDAGKQIAQNLIADDLKGIFILSPGLNVNGSEITAGIKSILPPGIFVSGGLAGDGTNFKRTCVVYDDSVSDKQVVAFGLYGDKVHIRAASSGGWKPFGPLRRVTKVDRNVLYELDGKPALALYKQYLGDKVAQLPASGLLYPFAIMDENKTGQKGLIRTILAVDEAANSLILVGNMETGSTVSLMHASTEELTEGARSAATKALVGSSANDDSSAALCVSCVGRKILMGEDTEEEVDAIREEFNGTPMAGFYSYGEICHHEDTDQPELHNQTMTITYISENAA